MRHNIDRKKEELTGITVVVRENESFELTLKRFKKKVTKSGILDEFKSRMSYEKPSARRRREKIEAYKKHKDLEAERERHIELSNKFK